MEHRRLAPLPAALVAVAVLLEAVAVPLSWRLEPVWDTLGYGAFSLAMVAAGALIVSRESHHRIGWLLVVAGYLNALTSDLPQGWGLRAAGHGWPAGPFGEWLNAWSWAPGFVWLVLLLVLFPTGRLPSRRWWVVVGTVVVGTMLTAVAWSLSAQTGADFVDGTNPYATDAVPTGVLLAVGLPLFLGSLVAAAASLLVRFRTAKGIERQQLKWLTFVAAADAVVLPAVVALWWVTPLVRPLAAVCLLAVPVATGMAVLRYRLYDIDVVINRSVVYGTLTVLLGGAYASVVLTLGSALGRRSSWVTAGATLLVAVAFGPLRARVQRAVDRRFDRTRFEALRRMDRFLDDLRAGNVAPEEVEGVLRSVLDDPALTLQFVLPESREWVDARGRPTTDRPDDERVRVRIDRAGATIATVRTERDRSNDRALLLDVVEAGVLAVEIARLRVELRRQLDEVRASRARIVAAGDRERR
ncbi:MAG: hypothetical protein QOJ19_4456, partial [Acidimicrobiia bacterium]|nr:hypothetical protein [Acidimicrobiia bacterium]